MTDARVCAESAHSCIDLTRIGFCNENLVNTLNSKWQQKRTRPHEAALDPECANSETSCDPGSLVCSGHTHSMPKTGRQWFPSQPLIPASAKADVWHCLRRVFCLTDGVSTSRSRWSAGTGSWSSSIGSRSSSPRRGESAIA